MNKKTDVEDWRRWSHFEKTNLIERTWLGAFWTRLMESIFICLLRPSHPWRSHLFAADLDWVSRDIGSMSRSQRPQRSASHALLTNFIFGYGFPGVVKLNEGSKLSSLYLFNPFAAQYSLAGIECWDRWVQEMSVVWWRCLCSPVESCREFGALVWAGGNLLILIGLWLWNSLCQFVRLCLFPSTLVPILNLSLISAANLWSKSCWSVVSWLSLVVLRARYSPPWCFELWTISMISDLKILHTRTGSHVLLNNIRRERGYLFSHEQTWSLDERPRDRETAHSFRIEALLPPFDLPLWCDDWWERNTTFAPPQLTSLEQAGRQKQALCHDRMIPHDWIKSLDVAVQLL